MDAYGRLLADVLFPAWERVRGRDTFDVLAYLDRTQWAPPDQLAAIQAGLLRRVLRHAYRHTAHYRDVMDRFGVRPEQIHGPADLHRLPLLDRATARASDQSRLADAPPRVVVVKATSGTSGAPMTVRYNAESRVWRDATRWRGYGWAGYRPGHKALHYWGQLATPPTGWRRWKIELDHALRRDHYIDSTPRGDDALDAAVAAIRRVEPDVIVAYAQGAAALARHVNRTGARTWPTIPVLCGAERLWPHDRESISEAFGPAVFETYGCREVMLIGSECEHHDGLHVSMETMIVELVVRDGDRTRAARPGEVGEVVVTDLHNLAQPMIRYVSGDLAMARDDQACPCGRSLTRIGPIEGRVTDTLRDGEGRPVSGLLFSILMVSLADHTSNFQVRQKKSGEVVLTLVPATPGQRLPPEAEAIARQFTDRHLPGVATTIEYVDDIPASAAGKRHLVVVER